MHEEPDGDQNHYYIMRHSLFFWEAEKHRWTPTEHVLGRLMREDVKLFVQLARARGEEEVWSCLHALEACGDDIRKAIRFFGKYAVVVVGPAATRAWRFTGAAPAQCRAACLVCESFAVAGRCERCYTRH